MAKKNKKQRIDVEGDDSEQGVPLNNPFGALGALRNSLPGAERPPEAVPKKSAEPDSEDVASTGVILRRERKGRGGKTITRVDGLPLRGAELGSMCLELKRSLGCGAAVEDDSLVLQGDQVERGMRALRKLGYERVRAGN
ncbi:MAG: translation initiation factor 1 [Planctomycetota bacterium]|jgi:translation initiation factor 1